MSKLSTFSANHPGLTVAFLGAATSATNPVNLRRGGFILAGSKVALIPVAVIGFLGMPLLFPIALAATASVEAAFLSLGAIGALIKLKKAKDENKFVARKAGLNADDLKFLNGLTTKELIQSLRDQKKKNVEKLKDVPEELRQRSKNILARAQNRLRIKHKPQKPEPPTP